MFDHLCAGFEGICGQRGNNFLRVNKMFFFYWLNYEYTYVIFLNYFRQQEKIERFDELYLRPIFTLSTEKDPLQRLFEKLTLSYAICAFLSTQPKLEFCF